MQISLRIVGFMAAISGIVSASRYASVPYNAFTGGPLLLEAISHRWFPGTLANELSGYLDVPSR